MTITLRKINFCTYFLQIKFQVYLTKYSYRAEKMQHKHIYCIEGGLEVYLVAFIRILQNLYFINPI